MNLFVYGTLLFPKIREAVGGRQFASIPARLAGYRIFRVRDAHFPGIVSSAEDCWIEGEILLDLSAEELQRFDRYEDSFYRRTTVRVLTDKQEEWEAGVYEIPPENAEALLTDQTWTRSWFAERHYAPFCAGLGLEE